ncbi:MAG: hypothetical protein KAV82_06105 [Phycisphaerae bacterium]|nr:hypothetical protein [Phycisphaerae bacterium]
MRRFGVVLLAGGLILWVAGCSGPQIAKENSLVARYFYLGATQSSTMTQSSAEHLHSLNCVVDLDSKALLGDLDVFWQRDRGMRLSRWHER